tara:strand:+ start:628 stop:885 length:258 start_codon:yes stop_codon:yes gene_type:complete
MEIINPGNQKPMNFKEWAINIFLASLPILGLILLLVWAFRDNGNIHRKEWAKGRLLIAVLGFVLVMMFLFLFGGLAILGAVFDNH